MGTRFYQPLAPAVVRLATDSGRPAARRRRRWRFFRSLVRGKLRERNRRGSVVHNDDGEPEEALRVHLGGLQMLVTLSVTNQGSEFAPITDPSAPLAAAQPPPAAP